MLKKIIKCPACGKEFIKLYNSSKYCSKLCNRITQQNRARIKLGYATRGNLKAKCKNCGNLFIKYHSLQKFCSLSCTNENTRKGRLRNWNEASRTKIMGKGNPCYRNGSRVNGKDYRSMKHLRTCAEYKKEFIEKNGYIYCEYCGTHQSLRFETHHVIFASEAPNHKNLHNHKNLMVLCIKCHNKFHSKRELRDRIVKKRRLDKLFPELLKLQT